MQRVLRPKMRCGIASLITKAVTGYGIREPACSPGPSAQSRISGHCAQRHGLNAMPRDTSSNAGKLNTSLGSGATTDNEDNIFIETNPTQNVGSGLSRPPPIT